MTYSNETTIGRLARLFNINKSHVNYYVSEGLVPVKRSDGRTAVLDEKFAKSSLKKILSLREKGASLEEIKGKLHAQAKGKNH